MATRQVDQLWLCSETDALTMQHLYPHSKPIQVIPNAVDLDRYEKARKRRHETPEGINSNGKVPLFPALFGWLPNAIAASFLINEIFPRLAAAPMDFRLVLAGAKPTIEMLDAAKREGRILVTGAILDMRPYFSAASVMVVPLLQGSGTRIKILEAFAAKVPVISTAKGAEDLAARHEKHLLLAETAEEFTAAVARIWANPALADRLTANALELATARYSLPATAQQIARAVSTAAEI